MSGGDRRRSDGLRSAGRCTDWPPADSAPKNPGRSDPARPTARRRRRPVAFCAACRRRLLVAGPNAHARVKRWPCPCRLLSCRPPSASGLPSDPRRTGLRAPRGNRPSRATSRGSPEPRRPRPLGSAVLFGQPRSEPNVKTVPDALLPLLTPFFRCARSYLVRKVESPPCPRLTPFTIPVICLSRSSSRWNVKRRRAYAPANRDSIQVSVKRKSAPGRTRPQRNSVYRRPSLARRRREGTAS